MGDIDFICVGAQKAASSFIAAALKEHPQIDLPKKEFYYFSSKGEYKSEQNTAQINYAKPLSWYKSQFSEDTRKSGEVSTHYLTDNQAAKRIKEAFPDVRVFVILRDPVERALSHYQMERFKHARENRELLDLLENEPENEIFTRGLYAKQLRPYLKEFPDMHVFFVDDLKQDPKAFVESICHYLGVDEEFIPSVLTKKHNPATVTRFRMLPKLLRGVRRGLQTIGLDVVVSWLQRTGITPWVLRITKRFNLKEQKYRATRKERDLLQEYYTEDIAQLEELLSRDLSAWKNH